MSRTHDTEDEVILVMESGVVRVDGIPELLLNRAELIGAWLLLGRRKGLPAPFDVNPT